MDAPPDLPSVRGKLLYLDTAAISGTPTNYFDVEPPPGVPRLYPRVAHEVSVYDARAIADRLSLDRQGFVLVRHDAGVLADVSDESALRSTYYASVERLVCEVSGAHRALVFDHTRRSSALAGRATDGVDIAVSEVHNDYNIESGPRRVRELLSALAPGEDVDRLMGRRYAVLNVWRPTNGVVQQMPLAICDMESMRAGDFVEARLRWPHRTGSVCAVAYSPAQRWFYAPAMAPGEALVFKCYDSVESGGVRFGAHSAFDDPTSPPGARVRESIEARVIALYR